MIIVAIAMYISIARTTPAQPKNIERINKINEERESWRFVKPT